MTSRFGISSPTPAVATVITLVVALACEPGAAGECTWGGTSAVEVPEATALRAYHVVAGVPGRIAVDGQDNILVTQPASNRIQVFDSLGRLTENREGFGTPLAIAVDPTGGVWVSEQEGGSITLFDEDWQPTVVLGQGDGEFVNPTDIAIDTGARQVRLFVADAGANLVRAYAPDGSQVFDLGGDPGELNFPVAVHVSAEGEVFVGDQINDRVQVFDRDGTFLRCFGGGSSPSFGRLSGLTVDALGRVYVADAFQGHVRVLDSDGVPLGTIGSFGHGPGQMRTPMGLEIDSQNRLFVASVNNARVEVFGLDEFIDTYLLSAIVRLATTTQTGGAGRLTFFIEIDGVSPAEVVLDSITANGVGPLDASLAFDEDHPNGGPDVEVVFDAASVLSGIAPSESSLSRRTATILIEGAVLDGRAFRGTATLGLPPRPRPARRSVAR